MERYYILNAVELFGNSFVTPKLHSSVFCFTIDKNEKINQFKRPCYINAFVYLLVLSGNVDVEINHVRHRLTVGSFLLLTTVHLFRVVENDNAFSAIMLFVDKDFPETCDTPGMVYKRMTCGFKMYNNPVLNLSQSDMFLLQERMLMLDRHTKQTSHSFYHELIVNSLEGMYLDLSNIIEKDNVNDDTHISFRTDVVNAFVQLLVEHYREEHHIDFYTQKLGISSHYLAKIVKKHTGQTAVDFIYDMLYSEARRLLQQSKLSIQQIAEVLNFSDQSAFGKFFKRKSDLSPFEYRKKMNCM